ncbi:Uncharacterised protein [Yersinia enterocolitica]|nr:Uncharacterised protein [Yersinia enterocolitica]
MDWQKCSGIRRSYLAAHQQRRKREKSQVCPTGLSDITKAYSKEDRSFGGSVR